MRRNPLALTLPVLLAAVFGFSIYSSCDQLKDDESSENKNGSQTVDPDASTAKVKGALCEDLIEMESYPVRYHQECVINEECGSTVEIPVADGGDPSTIVIEQTENDEAVSFEYSAASKSVLIAKDDCPMVGSDFSVDYTGKVDGQTEDGKIDNVNFSCDTVIGKSDPVSVQTTCSVKEACTETGVYRILLHSGFNPVDGNVGLDRNDLEKPTVILEYDAASHEVLVPWSECAEKDSTFVIGYKGVVRDVDSTSGSKKLYVHPCGNFDPVVQSCDNAGGYVDLSEPNFKTCAELNLNAGDVCPVDLEKCVMTPPKACGNSPTTKAVSAYFLYCNDGPITEVGCPVSERKFKKGIHYLSNEDQQELKEQIVNLRLAQYEYNDEKRGSGAQLGFIIDDLPDAKFLTSDGKRVNIYAYVSSLVAALQVQQREIDQLRRELSEIKSP